MGLAAGDFKTKTNMGTVKNVTIYFPNSVLMYVVGDVDSELGEIKKIIVSSNPLVVRLNGDKVKLIAGIPFEAELTEG